MSNERIDLTQFIGITKGPWECEFLTLVTAYPHPAITIDQTGDDLRLRLGEVSCPQDGKAMAKLPDLIAELKRCYEEIDEANKIGEALWNALDNWDICMDDYSMHDLYNNLDEKYARDYEGRIILKELYSYTEEDGWQPKEHASE